VRYGHYSGRYESKGECRAAESRRWKACFVFGKSQFRISALRHTIPAEAVRGFTRLLQKNVVLLPQIRRLSSAKFENSLCLINYHTMKRIGDWSRWKVSVSRIEPPTHCRKVLSLCHYTD
jgi:hypothetical protein